MDAYHLRRSEKAIEDPAEIRAIIDEGGVKERSIEGRDLADVLIRRIRVDRFTGKRNE